MISLVIVVLLGIATYHRNDIWQSEQLLVVGCSFQESLE